MQAMTMLDALTTCLQIAEAAGIAGMQPVRLHEHSDSLYLIYDRGWGIEATASIYFSSKGQAAVSVVWPSTTFTASGARAAAVLHGQVADLACLLDATLARMKIEVGS